MKINQFAQALEELRDRIALLQGYNDASPPQEVLKQSLDEIYIGLETLRLSVDENIIQPASAENILLDAQPTSSPSNAQITNILERIGDGFFALDNQWQFIYMNSQAIEILHRHGYTGTWANLIGKNIWESFPDTVGTTFYTEFQRAIQTQVTVEFEQFYSTLNFWVEIRAYPDANGLSVYIKEITDRKQIEEERRRSEQAFRTLAENAPDIIARFDKQYRHTYVNPAIKQATGLSPEALIGKTHFDLGFPEEIYSSWLEKFHHIFTTGEDSFYEFNFPAPDGTRYYQSHMVPEFALDGSVETVLGITRDVTEYKRIEQALRESETRFRRVVESNMIGIGSWEVNGKITQANYALLNLLGYTQADLQAGLDWRNLTPSEYHSLDLKALDEIKTTGICNHYEKKYIRFDGSHVPVLIGGAAFEGTTDTGIFFVLDLSDRQQLEEELQKRENWLRTIVDNASTAIYLKDLQGRYLLYNRKAEEITNLSRDQVIGKTDRELFPPEIADIYSANDRKALAAGKALQFDESAKINGRQYISLSVKCPLYDSAGVPYAICGISTDITERWQLQEALRQKEEQYRLLAHHFPNGGVFLFDRDLRYLIADGEAVRTNGFLKEEIEGKTLWEVLPLENAISREPFMRSALNGIETFREISYGGRIFAEHAIPVKNEQGQVIAGMVVSQDITDRQQAEQERLQLLQEVETKQKLLETVLQQMPAGVLIAEAPTGKILLMNEQVNQILNNAFPLVKQVGKDLYYNLDLNEGINTVQKLPLTRSIKNGEVAIGEEINFVKDRNRNTILANSAPIRDSQGQIIAAVLSLIDITARKQAEERIQLYADIVKNTQLGLAVWQLEDINDPGSFRVVTLNPAASQSVGIDLEQFIGKTIAESFPAMLETQMLQDYLEVVQTNKAKDLGEVQFEGEKAAKEIFLLKAFPLPNNCLGLAYDNITERKQIEEKLQQTLQKLTFHVENSPLGAIEYDREMRISRWSQAAERIFGWKAEEVLGKHPDQLPLIFPDDAEAVKAVIDTLYESLEPRMFICNRNYTKDGAVIHCEWYSSSLLDESGNMVSALCLVLDVSDRLKIEAERDRLLTLEQEARDRAETANRIKDEFLAVLSHELRSPLNAILGWSQMLRTRNFNQATTERAIEIIERNARMQTQLIEDLLDVSRILRGKVSLNITLVNLTSIIEAAIETTRLAAEVKSIDLKFSILERGLADTTEKIEIDTKNSVKTGQNPKIFVLGDPTRLQQVIWNLISNAIKFTPNRGHVEVLLSVITEHDNEQLPTQYAQIQVSDTGIGINSDFLPYIFEYFRQADASTTRKYGGLGLGLAIVHHLVEIHGGTVCVTSPGEGQGTTFIVKIPLASSSLHSVTSSSPNLLVDTPTSRLNGLQILVVDDDADARELVSFALEQEGAKVTTAASVSEAIVALNDRMPDVLISDIGMPSEDGYTMIHQLRAMEIANQTKQIPAIALTAYAREEDQLRTLAAGFQLHISKPLNPTELVLGIVKILTGNREQGTGNREQGDQN